MTRKHVRFGLGLGLLTAGWLVATPQPVHAAHWRSLASASDAKDPKPDGDAPKPKPKHGGDTPRPKPHPGPQDGGDR